MLETNKKRIMMVGGGTGGHFYPLIAVAEVLRGASQGGEAPGLYYLGPTPYDVNALNAVGLQFRSVPAGKRRRYFSPLNFLDPFKTLWGIGRAIWILYRIYPDVVFSKGGYTSVPVVLAAWLLRIPIVIHESDSKPGRANLLASRFARYIAIAFPEAAKFLPAERTALVGVPIRQSFSQDMTGALSTLGFATNRPLIFITGGSLGAERINNLILETLDELLPNYTLLHQTGQNNEERVRSAAAELISNRALLEHYYVKGTLSGEEMNLALSAASIIIARAGSTTIFEIAGKGKPSIIIPIPEEISHDQRTNAYSFARTGAASVLEEGNLTDSLLTSEISRIMGDANTYAEMSSAAKAFARGDAATVMARILLEIANEHV